MAPDRGFFGRLVREPLLHFLLIGAVVFGAYRLAAPNAVPAGPAVIDVSAERAGQLAQQFEAVWRRPPTPAELAGLVDDFVREEIYYREALALGLDRDDTVIRRRLRQKMEFLGDAGAGTVAPDEAELRAYFAAHAERFTPPAEVTFRQVLLDGTGAAEALSMLSAGTDPAEVGRGSLLPPVMEGAAAAAVDGTFGAGFFAAVTGLSPRVWSGPVRSAFGEHLVEVLEFEPASPPPFEAVRPAVEADWRRAKEAESREAQFRLLRERYEVILPAGMSP